MSGFADVVRNGVALADGLTATLQSTVLHYAWSGATVDDAGKVLSWGTATQRRAIVEHKSRLVRVGGVGTPAEQVRAAAIAVTFTSPVDVDPRDRIVMQDGAEGPVLDVQGLVDPATGKTYMTQVMLGA